MPVVQRQSGTHLRTSTALGPRLAAGALVLGLAGLTTTCKLQDLVRSSRLEELQVTPGALADSALQGSTAPRVARLALEIASEAVPWTLRSAQGSAWLHPGATSGTAPDTLTVTLDPTGLAAGIHRDTLVLTVAGPASAPVPIPVEFRVTGCVPTDVAPGATVTDTLTTADCGAPHRSGRFARVYRVAATASDSLSFHLVSSAFDPYLVVDTGALSAAVPALAENDACRPGRTDACVRYVRLPAGGTFLVEATSAAAGATGAFTFTVSRPAPPAAPDSLAQLTSDFVTPVPPGGTVNGDSIAMRALLTDPDEDSVRLDVEVQPVGTPFTGAPVASGPGAASGTRGAVVAGGLASGTAYHWQARAVDRTGRAGPWVLFGPGTADFSVSIPHPPDPPASLTQLKSDGVTVIPTGGTTDEATMLARGVVNDSDVGDVVRLEVEVRPLGTAFTNAATASSPSVARGTAATASVTGLQDAVAYHWQARAVDETGRASAWTPYGGNAETDADVRVAIAPAKLVLLAQPGTSAAGSALTPALRVAAQDASGNTLASFTGTVTVALGANAAGGTLSGTLSVAAVSGVATFSDLRIDRAGAGYTLTGTAGSLTVTTAAFTVVAAGAASLAFTVQPANATAGAAIAPAIHVTAHDSLGNVATGFADTVRLALTAGTGKAGAHLLGTTAVAAVSGVATFAAASVDSAATGYTLSASANGVTGATSAAFNVTAGAISPARSVVTVSSATVAAGGTDTLRLQARDAEGNAITTGGATVAFAASGGTSTGTIGATTDNANGTYTATFTGATAGTATTIGATVNGVVVTTALPTVTVTSGTATQIAINGGNGQSATAGTAVAIPPSVIVRDASNNPVAGVSVTFAVASGGGTVVPTAPVTTNASGIAQVTSWTLGPTAGGNTLTATATGLNGSPVTFTATATAGTATQIALNGGNGQSATVGTAVATPPSVIVRDASNNPVAGVAVTFAVASGGGTVAPTTSVATNASGIAQVTSWTLGTTAGANTLTATATGLTGSPVTFTATGTAGAVSASRSTTAAAPASISADGGTSTITVTALDADGNPIAGATVVLAATGTGNTLTQPSGPTNASGVATGTLASTVAEAKIVSATIAGVAITANDTVTVTAGAVSASQSTVTAAPTTIAPDGSTSTITVTAKDAHGNPIGGLTVVLAATGTGNTLTQPAGPTNVSGVATGTLASTVAESKTVSATAGGVGITQTATVNVVAGVVSSVNSTVTANPTTIAVGGAISQITVTAKDANNNPIAGATVVLSATGTGNTLTQPVGTTNSSGVATGTLSSTAAETKTVSATVNGVGITPTATVTVTAGAATQIAVDGGNNQSATVGSAVTTPPSVVVKDTYGNPVSGVGVAFAVGLGGGTVVPTTAITTNSSGIAQVTSWTLGTTAGTNTLTATSAGLTGSPVTFTATGTAGTATQIAVDAGDGQSATVGTAVATPPSVVVRDAHNNPVSGVSVAFAVATGGGSVDPTTAILTNASGIAQVNSWTLGTTAGTNTLTATSNGLSGSPVTFSATGTAGTATQIAVDAGDGQSATVGTAVATPPSVVVRDAHNNPVAGVSVTFAVATGGGSVDPITAILTNASGIAQVNSWTLGTTAGTNTLTATSNGLSGSPVTFTATGTASAATQIAANAGDGQTATAGTTVAIPPSVIVRDAHNNPVAGVDVTFAVASGGGSVNPTAAIATNASGIAQVNSWTLGTTAGTNTLTATSNGLSGSPVTFTATGTAGAVSASVSTVAAAPTSIAADGSTSTITVTAKDVNGNPIAGATVVLAATGSGNTLTQPSGTTSSAGVATGTLSSTVAESKTISATVNGVAITQTATVTVTSGGISAATSVVSVSSSTVVSGSSITLTLQGKDANGNNVTTGGATVAFTQSGTGTGTIAPSPATDHGNGTYTATFTGVLVGTVTIGATINAAAVTTTLPTVTVTTGPLSQLVVSGLVAAAAGTPQTVTVRATDAAGNTVNGFHDTVHFTSTDPQAVLPADYTFVGSDKGSRTFTDGVTLKTSGTQSVTVTDLANTSVNGSESASIGPAAISATTSTVSVSSSTVASGASVTLTLQGKDQYGNNETSGGATVEFGASGGTSTGSISPSPAADNANGIYTAAFTGVNAGTATTISATVNSVSVGTTLPTITVTSGAVSASQSSVSASPTSISADGGTSTITVTARDASGNPIEGATVVLSATGSANTLTQPTATTNSSGVATGTLSSTVAEQKTVSAAIDLVAVSQTAVVTVTAGATASIVVTPGATTLTALGATQAYTAEAQDDHGNVIGGKTFSWASNNTGVATVSPASGAGTTATAVADGSTTISASVDGITGNASLTVAQALDHIVVSPSAPTLTALGATQQFTAEAFDALNQPLATQPSFSWSSGTPATATIDAGTGLATAVADGTTEITAAAGGKSGSTTLTVAQATASVVVTPGTATLTALGPTQSFSAEARDANGNAIAGKTFGWASGDEAVATVSPLSGTATTATPLANGTSTISATVDLVTGNATLTVNPALSTTQAVPSQTCSVGSPCGFTPVTASGGTLPYLFALSGGSLPVGMSFDASTGAISGTPTASLALTTFTVTVTDSAGATSSQTFNLTVN